MGFRHNGSTRGCWMVDRYGSQSHAFTRLSRIIFLLRGPGCVIDTARISRRCVRSWAPNGHVFTCPWPCSNFLESIAWQRLHLPAGKIDTRQIIRFDRERKRSTKPWNNTSALYEKVWNFKLHFAGLKSLEFDLNLWTSFESLIDFLWSRLISRKFKHFQLPLSVLFVY